MKRRILLVAAAALGVGLWHSVPALAQAYPEKPITIVVPFAPGASDTAARIVAEHMTKTLGQRVLVENRPGASGAIGTEFVKRAAFAMLASLTVHDKAAPDANYLKGLKLIEREAKDDRNFVKKAVNWALRSIGKRNPSLNKAAIASAKRLAGSGDSTARWIGKDALREITSPAVQNRLARKRPQRA